MFLGKLLTSNNVEDFSIFLAWKWYLDRSVCNTCTSFNIPRESYCASESITTWVSTTSLWCILIALVEIDVCNCWSTVVELYLCFSFYGCFLFVCCGVESLYFLLFWLVVFFLVFVSFFFFQYFGTSYICFDHQTCILLAFNVYF